MWQSTKLTSSKQISGKVNTHDTAGKWLAQKQTGGKLNSYNEKMWQLTSFEGLKNMQ